MSLIKAKALIGDQRSQYVVINLIVNLLLLFRSYFFLIALDYRNLGLVAVLQSILLLIGMLQFGVLSGGYRLLLSESAETKQEITNFVYSFIAALSIACLLIAGIFAVQSETRSEALIALLGAIGGAASLMRNWQINQMIASARLKLLNNINILTALASLIPLAFIGLAPLEVCVAAVVLQPVMYVFAAWVLDPAGRPSGWQGPSEVARRSIAAGFLPFLAGMLLQANSQIERWYATIALSVEALGHLFVAIMFVTVLQLVPAALNAIFLPAAVKAHSADDPQQLRSIMRTYFALLVSYASLAALAVWFLAEPVLALLAPQYLADLLYVYLIAPGALLLCISGAFTLGFMVLIRYRLMIVAYATGTATLLVIIGLALLRDDKLLLEGLTIARSASLGITAIGTGIAWWLLSRTFPGMRFLSRSNPT